MSRPAVPPQSYKAPNDRTNSEEFSRPSPIALIGAVMPAIFCAVDAAVIA